LRFDVVVGFDEGGEGAQFHRGVCSEYCLLEPDHAVGRVFGGEDAEVVRKARESISGRAGGTGI